MNLIYNYTVGRETMDEHMLDRLRGCAVGAAIGDALGMPLEFQPPSAADRLVIEMRPGRLPAGSFTDDTEMALTLADSLLTHFPLDGDDLAQRFVAWYEAGPPDVGIQTSQVLSRIEQGETWQQSSETAFRKRPGSAGNGSLMRTWPVALAHFNTPDLLAANSRLQSRVTHAHPDCTAACAITCLMIGQLSRGTPPAVAFELAVSPGKQTGLADDFHTMLVEAPFHRRSELKNSGWVRHTLESAVWGLMTTHSFEEAVIQVANLGGDADTAASVVGALAGAAYGLSAIPQTWLDQLQGEWPLHSGCFWQTLDFINLANRLVGLEKNYP
jgi:ADP-ribosyl-[dinitrogen reductase] hydrolase